MSMDESTSAVAGTTDRDPGPPRPAYASFGARARALTVDASVVLAAVVVTVLAAELTRSVEGAGRVLVALLFAEAFLYEPLLVWRFGGTVGHRRANLRVVDDATGGDPGLGRAAARFAIKAALGLPSFAAMAVTRRHQAVHDRLTSTTVQLRDLALADPADYRHERPTPEPSGLPSRARRIAAAIAYAVALLVAGSVVAAATLSAGCAAGGPCTRREQLLADAVTAGWLAGSIACAVAAWRGRVWGSRAGGGPPA